METVYSWQKKHCVRRSLNANRAVVCLMVGAAFTAPMCCFAHGPLSDYCAAPPAKLFSCTNSLHQLRQLWVDLPHMASGYIIYHWSWI